MTVSHLACSPVSETMWAKVENKVTVVWKRSHPEADQIAQLIHSFDVFVCFPGNMKACNMFMGTEA